LFLIFDDDDQGYEPFETGRHSRNITNAL